ncbi:MAG TPA: hypothetical protein VHS28_06230 [Chloroflexota bacterium]|nr:hypothetical protein [Chloroflexota bacterium]
MSSGELTSEHPRITLFVVQCAWCRSVRISEHYYHIPLLPLLHWHRRIVIPFLTSVALSTSHSACPSCAEKVSASAEAILPELRDNLLSWASAGDDPAA